MLFIVLLAYRQPLDVIDRHLEAHRAFLARHYRAGHFLLSGPLEPREGGAILARAPDRATLDIWLREDPFHVHDVASYNVVAWTPTLRADEVDTNIAPAAAIVPPAEEPAGATNTEFPVAVRSADVPPRIAASAYPAPFALRLGGREKRVLGDLFGLHNFGVNHVTLQPGAQSALRHGHSHQDEFVHVLDGELVLVTDAGKTRLTAGMSAGFRAGSGDAHQLLNRGSAPAVYLEIGDRSAGDRVYYPDDDLQAVLLNGRWSFTHKDGTVY